MSKRTSPIRNYLNLIIWIIAIALRIYGATTKAQPYDISTFNAWGNHLLTVGPSNFFDTIWSDYLPFPILTFGLISWFSSILGLSFGLVFKLTYSALELLLIYLLGVKLKNLPRWPLWLILLSPASIGDLSFWGQIDPIPSLLALLSLTYLLNPISSLSIASLLFGLAVAYKPIMILAAPILAYLSLKRRSGWWSFPLLSSLVFFATDLPFVQHPINVFSHLFSRVLNQANTYPYTTINGWNLWSIVPSRTWLSDLSPVLSLTPQKLGLILFTLTTLVALRHWYKTGWDKKFTYRVIATILILFYALTTRMHERHLFFGLPFLALATISESWLLIPLAILTTTFTLNLYGAFYWVNHAQMWPYSLAFISLASWLTLATTLALALIWSWSQFIHSIFVYLRSHKLLLVILTIASLLRITNLGYPRTYIFDEVYHAYTAREYLSNHIESWEWWTTPPQGVAYEWTHPPVAKYGMVLGMLLFGENSFGWRIGSALAGIISIYGLYLLTLALTKNHLTATLATFLVSLEGLHISQSRIAMNDIYMLAFLVWSLYLAVKSRWKGSSVLYGLALASKWSGLYGLLPLALIYLHQNRISPRSLLLAFRLLLIVTSIYVLTFTPFILAGHTWAQFVELHRQMWYYHTHLVATHAYQSTPLQWITSLRPVWYYVDYGAGVISNIYAQSNPLILWLGLAALILQLKKIFTYPLSLFYLLYFIFTLPWIFSPRIMFFYHYLPSATFLCLILATWLSGLAPRTRTGILLLCCLGILVVSPMLYGFPMTQTYWRHFFTLFPSWK